MEKFPGICPTSRNHAKVHIPKCMIKNELSANLKIPRREKAFKNDDSADYGINMHPGQMFPVRRKMQVKFMHNLMNKQKLKKISDFQLTKNTKIKGDQLAFGGENFFGPTPFLTLNSAKFIFFLLSEFYQLKIAR